MPSTDHSSTFAFWNIIAMPAIKQKKECKKEKKGEHTDHIECLRVSHNTCCQIYQHPQALHQYCGFLFAWINQTKTC